MQYIDPFSKAEEADQVPLGSQHALEFRIPCECLAFSTKLTDITARERLSDERHIILLIITKSWLQLKFLIVLDSLNNYVFSM